jgi:MoxR-like ATPase
LTLAQQQCQAIIDNIGTVIVGKEFATKLLLVTLLCQGHVLIEDVPGVGKTSLAYALSKSVDGSFRRIQFTPDILPSDITGFSMYNPKLGEFVFQPGQIMSSFILADEINRTSPKTQASLLEVMQDGQVTVDGVAHEVEKPFMVLATQNPVEYAGTYPLPEAQMDRFLMRISLGYPSQEEEVSILKRFRSEDPLQHLRAVIGVADILSLQQQVRDVRMDSSLYLYITELVRATRLHPQVELGSSPRGSMGLFHASQAYALMQGRDYIIPDDIKHLAFSVLPHRLVLKHEAKLKGITQAGIINELLSTIPLGQPTGRDD